MTTTPDTRGIYFDASRLGEPDINYVCWIDVMGSADQMLRSLPAAATFVYKLHCAVLEAYNDLDQRNGVLLYPVMDGVYLTTRRRAPLQKLLNQALRRIVTTFINEGKCYHQYLVRGAVAYGPIYHGRNLDKRAAWVLDSHSGVRDSVLLGLPMAQAYLAEHDAPPFGIAVHSSARAFAPEGDHPFRFIWLDWFRSAIPPVDTDLLLEKLGIYFDWQKRHSNMTGYDPSRIEHHRKLALEFLTAGD